MSQLSASELFGAWRAICFGVTVAVLTALGAAPTVAQELPPCDDGMTVSDCLLPAWPDESLRDAPSLFGTLQVGAWVTDAVGDVAANELDILAVGVAPIIIESAAEIRGSSDVMTAGNKKKAVKAGPAVIVRIVLDRPVDAIEEGHAGIHVVTDIDGSRTNNAPAGVGNADGPFAGMQDVYSLTYATTTQANKLLQSDLARGWYKGKRPFAASWAAPDVLDILVPAEAVGAGLKVVTFVSGPNGGYDSITLGPGSIPVVGRVRLNPLCAEASISDQPFTVRRLVENGQTLRDITAPASWVGGAAIPLDEASRATVEAWVAASDDDGDGRIALTSTVSLLDDGLIIRQESEIGLALDGDAVQLAMRLGLTRRGYDVVRNIVIDTTGDAAVDAYLARATEAFVQVTPAFRNGKKGGLLYGGAIGGCVTELITAPAPATDEGDAAAPSGEPAASA